MNSKNFEVKEKLRYFTLILMNGVPNFTPKSLHYTFHGSCEEFLETIIKESTVIITSTFTIFALSLTKVFIVTIVYNPRMTHGERPYL